MPPTVPSPLGRLIARGFSIVAATLTVSATKRLLGRNSAGAGAAEEVSLTELLDWVGSAAQGDILYRNATTWVRLGAGTSGQFLKTNGASANPSWADPSLTPGAVDQAGFLGRYWAHETVVGATAYQSTNLLVNFTGTGSSAADIANDGLWIRNTVTAATTGSATTLQAITSNQVRRRWSAVHVLFIKTYTDVSSIRLWAGLTSAAPQASDDPSSAHFAMFRYSTAVDGTAFWRTCTKDGSTIEVQATSVAIATDTPYLLRIELDSGEVRFYIDNTLVATHSSNIPGIDTPMGQNVSCTTLANANRSIRYARQWGLLRT